LVFPAPPPPSMTAGHRARKAHQWWGCDRGRSGMGERERTESERGKKEKRKIQKKKSFS